MIKYKIIDSDGLSEDKLNALSIEGWELMSVVPITTSRFVPGLDRIETHSLKYHFKKEYENVATT